MSETISPRRFHDLDWRVVNDDACAHFRTGSFAAGVALVDAIGWLPTFPAISYPPVRTVRTWCALSRAKRAGQGG